MKLLVLLSRIPFPLEKGDKLRAYHQIKQLSVDHDIVLVALGKEKDNYISALENLKPFCKEIKLIKINLFYRFLYTVYFFLKGCPLQTGYFFSFKARRFIKEKVAHKAIDHVYCQLFRTAEIVKNIEIPKTIDYQDAFSSSMKKRTIATRGLKKQLLSIEYKRIREYEKKIYNWFNNHIIISKTDQKAIGIPSIQVIRNGVDYKFFCPGNSGLANDLIFAGNMSYVPNVHTAIYIVKEVMPLIWEKRPHTNLVIAGASPSPQVNNLKSDQVMVTGWINDIREAYEQSKVFIAPMQIGTGLQNKILEAMAMELPCITSGESWKPIGAQPGKEIFIANYAEEYANIALDLLNDEQKRKDTGIAARKFITNNFSWEACTEPLNNIISNMQQK